MQLVHYGRGNAHPESGQIRNATSVRSRWTHTPDSQATDTTVVPTKAPKSVFSPFMPVMGTYLSPAPLLSPKTSLSSSATSSPVLPAGPDQLLVREKSSNSRQQQQPLVGEQDTPCPVRHRAGEAGHNECPHNESAAPRRLVGDHQSPHCLRWRKTLRLLRFWGHVRVALLSYVFINDIFLASSRDEGMWR